MWHTAGLTSKRSTSGCTDFCTWLRTSFLGPGDVRRATCSPTHGWKRWEPGALCKCWAQCSDLRHGRGQVAEGPCVLAEVGCLTQGSFWPRSRAEPWILRVGRKSCNAGTDSRVWRYDVGGRWQETDFTRTVLKWRYENLHCKALTRALRCTIPASDLGRDRRAGKVDDCNSGPSSNCGCVYSTDYGEKCGGSGKCPPGVDF